MISGVEMDNYLLVAKGSPAMVKSVPLGSEHASWEPLVPITDVSRPTAVEYDPLTQTVYYSDVHRSVVQIYFSIFTHY